MELRALFILVIVLWMSTCSSRRRVKMRLRLQGGTQPYAGRVQVLYRGTWGGICDNGWNKANAQVVCRHLGYKGVVLFTKGMFYGRQTGPRASDRRIWLDRVSCGGHESRLDRCSHRPWGRVRCNRERLAGVMCDPGKEALTKLPPLAEATKNLNIKLFKTRLVSSQSDGIVTEGILEVKYGTGAPGHVCRDRWSMREARVACGELGFTHAVDKQALFRWTVMPYRLTKVACTGSEASLLSCSSSGLGDHNCTSGKPVWLKCETRILSFPQARLRGGIYPSEGRADVREFRSNPHWATLCDKDLDIRTANVICRSAGYGTAYEYTLGTVFAHSNAKIARRYFRRKVDAIYEQIQCTGKEPSLRHCRWRAVRGYHSACKHYSDAGVRCNAPKRAKKFEIRLTGSRSKSLGTVEVNIGGKWGVICGDRWTMKNAMVVCRQLGLGYASYNMSRLYYGRNGQTMMSGTACFGNETSLDQCLHHSLDNVTCSGYRSVAGAACQKATPDLVWDVHELAKTLRLDSFSLGALQCSFEEGCLASSATAVYNSYRRWNHYRRLMRFSAKVHNVGTAAYRPYRPRNAWEWHSCHRHYHSDEEFALYDLINDNHEKVAEGHKASYCLEDTKCDAGVKQFFNCTGGRDQGISVNCHDNYDYTLDCQWVDVTDLRIRRCTPFKLRLIANPSFKVAESDYTNNVVLCDIRICPRSVYNPKCFLENCVSGVRSRHGNGNFACCQFPFIYQGKSHNTCIEDENTRQFWCSTTKNFDADKLFGYC